MSGGSYDYLCDALDAADLAAKQHQLVEMAERLAGINPDGYAAADTYEVLAALKAAEHLSRRLRDVWHAVEWRDSNDWGDDQMMAVLDGYERQRVEEDADPSG